MVSVVLDNEAAVEGVGTVLAVLGVATVGVSRLGLTGV